MLHEEIEKTDNVARTQLGEIQLNCYQINKLVHAQCNLQEDLNFHATRVAGVVLNSIPPVERRIRDLEQGNVINGLMVRLEVMEDRLNAQHEEIAVLRGWVCQCGGQPKIVEEEIEGIEELYAKDDAAREDVPGRWTSVFLILQVTEFRPLGPSNEVIKGEGLTGGRVCPSCSRDC